MAYAKYGSDAEKSAARAVAYAKKLEWLKTPEGRESQLNSRMKSLYGITLDKYRELLAGQNGCCAICGLDSESNTHGRLYVDHCHVSGEYRGLLCNKCNSGIGKFADDAERLERAANYLRRNHAAN